jgi:hypothetical protein
VIKVGYPILPFFGLAKIVQFFHSRYFLMDSARWPPFTVTSSPPNSERRFTSPSVHSQYESVVHSPEHSITDSLEPMDMTGSWPEHSSFPQVPQESDSSMFSIPSHLTTEALHINTTSLPIANGSRTFPAPLTEQESSNFQFRKSTRYVI